MPETKRKSPDFFKSLNSFARHSHQTIWLATGFLESGQRQRSLMILCLDGEFHRIATTISEAMVAQIRLQWWRDEIDNILAGKDTQQTDPALSLEGLLLDYEVEPRAILDLINAYDDVIAGDEPDYGGALFRLLMNDAETEESGCANLLGRYFQTANAGAPDRQSLDGLKQCLQEKNDVRWPWMCLLEFAADWESKAEAHALIRRWRFWKAFLAGEKRLLKKLETL
ncbi:squalene/phytoene synthase family protein [Ponticaulis koreensis]|uniref:squalene/phytoene synthase family protein n=1 Tax=Ponticaulis koreensis TaxID=1123045 RepID=UPI0003B62B20|nr:squalene/phytoene synthase family protein [Ponticaulis koreensis]